MSGFMTVGLGGWLRECRRLSVSISMEVCGCIAEAANGHKPRD
jgi:hypothetical protein